MRIITKREMIKAVRNRWRQQYSKRIADGDEYYCRIDDGLFRLDLDTCTSADVDAVIGRGGWTDNRCSECGLDRSALVRLGDEDDNETPWIDLCEECLDKAKRELSEAQ